MLMPKRTKHRKMFRGRMKGNAQRGTTVAFGEYGLQALEPSWITNRQIESCRVGINRTFKREGKTFIRIFPEDRKSTRLNSSHANISYAVFCLKKKKKSSLLHRTLFKIQSRLPN